MIRIEIHHHHHIVNSDPGVPTGLALQILRAVGNLEELITMNDAQLKEKLEAISAQTTKVFGEVSTSLTSLNDTITALQEALANAGGTSPEVDALVQQLSDQVSAIDNLIPDAPPAEG